MTTWRIGIDEHGLFDAMNPDDDSFVCAVITQKSDREIEAAFRDIYQKVTNCQAPLDTEALLKFFHGSRQMKGVREKGFKNILQQSEKLYSNIVQCNEKPVIFANNQQWWASSVLGVMKKICSLDFISPKDTLEIFIDCRKSLCLGLLTNDDGDSETIKNNLKLVQNDINVWRNQKNIIEDEDFDIAFDRAYIAAKNPKLRNEAFNAMIQLIAISNSRKSSTTELDPTPYDDWMDYKNKLEKSFRKEVKKIFFGTVKLKISSAKKEPIVALADQICGINKPDFLRTLDDDVNLKEKASAIQASVQNLTYGRNLAECIKDGEFLDACDILLSQIFEGKYSQKRELDNILNEASQDVVKVIWQKIFNACEASLNNRGNDGEAIRHVAQIFPIIDQHEKDIPDTSLRIRYLKLHRELSAHSGKISDSTHFDLEELLSKDNCEFVRDTERWSFYVEAAAIQAQINFNAYDFSCVEIEKMIETQEQLASIKYPFSMDTDERVDENAAMLYGTIGQAAAFSGNLEKASLYFDRDYRFASDKTKKMPASYMLSVCHRQENLDKALVWFEKETGAKFEAFGQSISQKTNLWSILSYFRIYALAVKKGVLSLPEFPEKYLWARSGWYPWPLLLKWAAYSKACLNQVDEAVDFLQTAYQELSCAPGFTVKSLALSPMAMLIQISKQYKNDNLECYQFTYKNNLEGLCTGSPTFAKYVGNHPKIVSAAEGDGSLWDAAMMLPFNYA